MTIEELEKRVAALEHPVTPYAQIRARVDGSMYNHAIPGGNVEGRSVVNPHGYGRTARA